VGDAHVHEMAHRAPRRRGDRRPDRGEVDGPELRGLERAWPRRADEVDHRVGRHDGVGESFRLEGIAEHDFHSGRERALRTRSHERTHSVASAEQRGDKRLPHVPGTTGDEDRVPFRRSLPPTPW
jgi:hypothetical protein